AIGATRKALGRLLTTARADRHELKAKAETRLVQRGQRGCRPWNIEAGLRHSRPRDVLGPSYALFRVPSGSCDSMCSVTDGRSARCHSTSTPAKFESRSTGP